MRTQSQAHESAAVAFQAPSRAAYPSIAISVRYGFFPIVSATPKADSIQAWRTTDPAPLVVANRAVAG